MALAEFTVAFREWFEISLIIGIMLAYLHKSGRRALNRYVWAGAGLAALASVAAAYAFEALAGGFARYEAAFEGITLLAAAVLVSWLIIWMFGQRNVREGIQKGMEKGLHSNREAMGVLAFAFVAVLREGIEMVLFFYGIRLVSGGLSVLGALAGAALALGLAWAVFRSLLRLDLSLFFRATGVILLLMAGGLVSQGVHELQEAGWIPTSIEHVYDLNPPAPDNGPYPLFHEKGVGGTLLRTTVGMDFAPSLEQLMAHLGYFGLMVLAYQKIGCAPRTQKI